MTGDLRDQDWDVILRRISKGKCTPFLGAGVNYGHLPLGADIARSWAEEEGFPLDDRTDLARVAQFLAVKFKDAMDPKERIQQYFEGIPSPDFDAPNEPLNVLAGLPVPVFLTTNYDNFLFDALTHHNKDPKRELCRWNQYVRQHQQSVFDSADGFRPTIANPLVFHLHGHIDMPESLVLTEDDYLDFLVNISGDEGVLPARVQEALTGASLLFVGYKLEDWNFRVLFRGLVASMEASLRRINLAVQLSPSDNEAARDYLTDYFDNASVHVYWGTAESFAAELQKRLAAAPPK